MKIEFPEEWFPIKSFFDSDQYKYSMQAAYVALYPEVTAEIVFINRSADMRFSDRAVDFIKWCFQKMADVKPTEWELEAFQKASPFLPAWYFDTLRQFRFNPDDIIVEWNGKDLNIYSRPGVLLRNICLWEIPILAIVEYAYYKFIDTDWNEDGQEDLAQWKRAQFEKYDCRMSDFGTRSRRNFKSQERIVKAFKGSKIFVGTSNVFLALKYGVKPIGTMAHEWIMIHQVVGSIRHCNRDAMYAWKKVYKGSLGIALTDTIGTDTFFRDFDSELSHLFTGLRHDSGPTKPFVDKSVNHYQQMLIRPITKDIIFSDSLTAIACRGIREYCDGKIGCAFGVGTSNTNDYKKASKVDVVSKPMNIVVKTVKCNGVPIFKTSDVPGKAIGDRDALRVGRWLTNQIPLDTPLE